MQGQQGIRERNGKQRRASKPCEVMVMFTVFVAVMLPMMIVRSVMQIVVGCHMDGFMLMNNHRSGMISENGKHRDGQRQEYTKRTRTGQSAEYGPAIPQGTRKRSGRIRFRHDETRFVLALLAFRAMTCQPISSKIRLKLMTLLTWLGFLELPSSAASPVRHTVFQKTVSGRWYSPAVPF